MTFLAWGQATPSLHDSTGAELDAARDTDIAVISDDPIPTEDTPPDKAAPPDVDPRIRLGLTTRSTSSYVVPSVRYAPEWVGYEVGQVVGNDIPDAGYASTREKLGEFGHGTLPTIIGITPAIGNAPGFGERYFTTHDRPIQDNETADEWGIQPGMMDASALRGDSAYAAQQMIAARHGAETSKAFDFNGLWD